MKYQMRAISPTRSDGAPKLVPMPGVVKDIRAVIDAYPQPL